MLELTHIYKKLKAFKLEDINFRVKEGEYFILLGESGAGKSILLEIIAGLIKPDKGNIFLQEKEITYKPIQQRPVGLVFQDYAIFPHMSVFDNIAYSLHSVIMNHTEIQKKVNEIAEQLDIKSLLKRNPKSLSGGEQQRVALARTLILKPKCLLLDEPLSSLDTQLQKEIRSLLRNINKAGQTIIHVTHHYEEAIALANRIGVLENGTISQIGTPDEVFSHPKSEFIANFCGIANFYKGILYNNKPNEPARFETNGISFYVNTDTKDSPGHIYIKGENITISNEKVNLSSRNFLEGTIEDIEPIKQGYDVIVNIGIKITVAITASALKELNLFQGKHVFLYIKATGIKFIS
jgi:molybdopterin-binding protein